MVFCFTEALYFGVIWLWWCRQLGVLLMLARQESTNQTMLMPYTTSIMKESRKWLFALQLRSGKDLVILILMVKRCRMRMTMEILLLLCMYLSTALFTLVSSSSYLFHTFVGRFDLKCIYPRHSLIVIFFALFKHRCFQDWPLRQEVGFPDFVFLFASTFH